MSEDIWSGLSTDLLWRAPGRLPVAIGGALRPDVVLPAYRRGIVAMAAETAEGVMANREIYGDDVEAGSIVVIEGDDDPYALTWWYPRPRYALDVFRTKNRKDARKSARRGDWWTSTDRAFDQVVSHCAQNRSWTWITPDYTSCINSLFDLGHAHSIEIWAGETLIGGAFGVVVGEVWIGESVFNTVPNAGKAAVGCLARLLAEVGGALMDWQFRNALGDAVGAEEVSLERFTAHLEARDITFPVIPSLDNDWIVQALAMHRTQESRFT